MKISAAIVLLFCLLAPFSGSYVFLHFKKKQIREDVNRIILNELDKKDLIVLKFTEDEVLVNLKWKHAREFEYRGHMYDVVETSRDEKFIIYTCYKDHKETRLNRERDKLFAKALGQDPSQKKQNDRIKNYLTTLFQPEFSKWKFNPIKPSIIHYSSSIKHYSLFTDPPPSPPPKYC